MRVATCSLAVSGWLALASVGLTGTPTALASAPDGAFVVKPYLQLGSGQSDDTLQVLWHAEDADASWSVESRVKGSDAWVKGKLGANRRIAVKDLAPHRVLRATLTRLAPGQPFEYRVLRGEQVVFAAEATARKSASQPLRFVAFGDCGAGTPEQKPLGFQAYSAKPDLVVIPGDIVYEHGTASEYRTKFWPAYNADDAAPNGGVPLLRSSVFVAAPGNHDTATRDLDKYPGALAYYMFWDQPLNGPIGKEGGAFVPPLTAAPENRAALESAAGDAYPRMANFSFDYGPVHWTMIDSNPYVDWTDKELRTWLEQDLAAARSAAWRLVVFHHPGFNSSREHFEQQQMRALAPIFETGRVDVVLNGHVHNYQRSYPMRFKPDNAGTKIVGKDDKIVRGRVINGPWILDKSFNGHTNTTPDGVIYVVTGAGGQKLYNPEQQDQHDNWQGFTDKFVSKVHSITVADVDASVMTVRQVTTEGREVDRFVITKNAAANRTASAEQGR